MKFAPTDSLTFHPLVVDLPGLMPEQSPEFAALVEDIAARGVDVPLIVTPGGVIDGRNRFRGALAAGIGEVPVVEREEAEAPEIILAMLVHRRHYTKGALAYVSYPVLREARSRGVQRRSANLLQGSQPRMSTQSAFGESLTEIAARLGFSRDLFEQAAKVHSIFSTRPDLRAEFEPRILAGEVGLGACVAGLASSMATTGSSRTDRTPYTLIQETFAFLQKRFDTHWGKLDRSIQHALTKEATDTVMAFPPEVRESIAAALTGKPRRTA